MQPSHHDDSAHRLLERLRCLIDGNHVRAAELRLLGHEADDYGVDAWVAWTFSSATSLRTVLGNSALPGAHHGFDRGSLDETVNSLRDEAAFDLQTRVPFMHRVVAAAEGALAWAHVTQTVKDYGEQSVHRHCGTCGGKGEVACGRCGGSGKYTCTSCGGTGSRPTLRTTTHWNGRHSETHTHTEYLMCISCGGTCRVVCSSCGGSGREQCSICHGHGFFTDIIHVTGIAVPSWRVRPEAGLAWEALETCFQQIGPAQSAQHVAFGLSGTEHEGDERWLAHYRGIATVIELHCDLKGQRYDIPAVGSQPYPLLRPPIFDQVLATEIAALKEASDAGLPDIRLSGAQAHALFSDFRQLPVLDTALRSAATLQGDSRKFPENTLSAATDGFISPECARRLGIGMLVMLDKVSPPYSMLSWWVVLGLPVVAAFFSTEYSSEPTRDWSGWLGATLMTTAVVLLGIAVLSPLAWLASALVSGARRLRVPAEYRQRGRNWEPQKYVYAGALSASLLGAVLAAAVKSGWVPPLHERFSRAVQAISARVLAQPIVPSPLPRENEPVEPPSGMSDTQVYREIQQRLQANGYLVPRIDGKPGPATLIELDAYRKRERLPPNLPAREVLEHMRKGAPGVERTLSPGHPE